MNTRSLLVEIGTEELPPGRLEALGEFFGAALARALADAGFAHGAYECFATPRRLAARIAGVAPQQAERIEERTGPLLEKAYDEHGKPTPAATGFARSCGVAVDDLQVSGDGRRLYSRREVPGAGLREVLGGLVGESLQTLPIAKRMRWDDQPFEFIRPVRWVLALHGAEAIAFDVMGVRSGAHTLGHRCHCSAPLAVSDADVYEEVLEKEGRVMASFARRREYIGSEVRRIAKAQGSSGFPRPGLHEKITAMVEWPSPVYGRLDDAVSATVPKEVIMEVLENDQKVIPMPVGEALPGFITVANVAGTQPEAVRQGYERVIRSRLADAAFFFAQDKKRNLESRLPELETIVFHDRLGTLADKSRRLVEMVQAVAECIHLRAELVPHAMRAAQLCKADLSTDMVREYPSLQGVAGGYYARHDGEEDAVAAAISRHYLPRYADDDLPVQLDTPAVALALADRLDTLVGIFGTGAEPSGSKDPYALRRAALVLIRIGGKHPGFDLQKMIVHAEKIYQGILKADTAARVSAYLVERLRSYCLGEGAEADEVEAALAVNPLQLHDFRRRLHSLRDFKKMPQAESLAAANKRIRNILKKNDAEAGADVAPDAMMLDAERALYDAFFARRDAVMQLVAAQQYLDALQQLAELREPIDRFFGEVLVMSENADERRNRIGLLREISGTFSCIADFSKLNPGVRAQ